MKRILIADDDELIRELLSRICDLNKYNTIMAKNGTEALSTARETLPDLILMDTDMPGLTGDIVCQTLKNEGYPGFIIGMSGNGDNKTKWREAGANDFVKKPFSLHDTSQKIRAYLGE